MPSNPPDDAGLPASSAGFPQERTAVDRQEAEIERLARSLPPEEREQLLQVVRTSLSVQHSGPLPTPEFLRQYEAILPGLAERIVRMPEREQLHRHEITQQWLTREARLKARGQVFGLVALLILLAFCAFLAWSGSPKVAGGVAVATVVAVVGIFVTGRVLDAKTSPLDDD